MTTSPENPAIYVRQIDTPTDAVLIRALGADEHAGCAVFQPEPCTSVGSLQISYYDPDSTHGEDGNYCGAVYVCSMKHALLILSERAEAWLPTVPGN